MIENINLLFKNYLINFPEEEYLFHILKKQIQECENIISRKNFNGHVTASGLVIVNNEKVLVVFHNKLQKYLQPGGHIEITDKNLMRSAEREVREETGLKNIILHSWCLDKMSPIFINTHKIPENKTKSEDEHYHHDFMFIFFTDDMRIFIDKNESSDFNWIDIGEVIKNDSNIAKALKKMNKLQLIG